MADGRPGRGKMAGPGRHCLKASLALGPGLPESPLAWSPRPLASRRELPVARPAVFLAPPLTASALCATFLAILIGGCLSRARPGGASALAGTSAAVRETPVTPGIAVLPVRCRRPTVKFAVDLQ